MKTEVSIGLVGDHDLSVPAHRGIPAALELAAGELGVSAVAEWIPTEDITSAERVVRHDGIWCVPASPYRSTAGALRAIRHARECSVPFLGTCGGFQHAVLEYARNVVGWSDAAHGEEVPDATRQVISELECHLVEATETVRPFPGSRIAAAYGVSEVVEGYRCRYGLNPEFLNALLSGPLRPVADDAAGEVRAVELDGHPFFVATLFQPERAALRGVAPPLAVAFLQACRG